MVYKLSSQELRNPRSRCLAALVCACLTTGCATKVVQDGESLLPDYSSAITEAEGYDEKGPGWQFFQCQLGWRWEKSLRERMFKELRSRQDAEFSLVLEIGSTPWIEYHFVSLVGNSLMSDRGKKSKALTEEAVQALQGMVDQSVGDIRGFVDHGPEDGPCYFLTLHDGSLTRRIAYFGIPRLDHPSGRIISRLLWEADRAFR